MKCRKCGSERQENDVVCPICGDNSEQLKVVYEEVDFDIYEKKRMDLSFVLLIFSVLSLVISVIIAFNGKPINLIYICIYIVFIVNAIVFLFLSSKTKYRIIYDMGLVISFISLLITLYCVIVWLIEILKLK